MGRLAGGLAVVGVLVLWNPIVGFGRTVAANLSEFTAPMSDFEATLSWIATTIEATTQVLAPPHEDSIFYLTERPQYVSWGAIPYDRMDEWIERLDAVVSAEFISEVRRSNEWQEQYRNLTVDEILALRPAVDVVVTDGESPLELLFERGRLEGLLHRPVTPVTVTPAAYLATNAVSRL